MADLGRRGAGARVAEEEHIGGREMKAADPGSSRYFAAHLVGRSPPDDVLEQSPSGEGAFVYTPDEPRAVETAPIGDSEKHLRVLGRAAPDVRVADEVHRAGEHAVLPSGQVRQGEAIGEGVDPVG